MAEMKQERVSKSRPSDEYRFFLYDPEGDGDGVIFFKSAEDRDKYANKVMHEYHQDGWYEQVEEVCAGTVTHIVKKTNVIKRPPEDEIDEEGLDGEGNYWDPDWSEMCNYELTAISAEG